MSGTRPIDGPDPHISGEDEYEMRSPQRDDPSDTRPRVTRRTFIGGVAAVTGTAIATAACGPAASPGPGATGTQAGAASPAATGPLKADMVFSHIWASAPDATGDKKHPAEQLVDVYDAKKTGVTVTSRVDGNYYEVLQKVQAELAAGRPPALAVTPWANLLFADASLGITAMEDYAPKAELDKLLGNYKPATVELVRLNGKTMGLPFALSTPVIYYNNDILKKAGVEPGALLKDWDSFASLGPKVKASTGQAILGFGTNFDWPMQSLIQNAGGRVMDESNQPAMDSPDAIAALAVMADLKKAGLFSVATTKENNAAFRGGTMALFMTSIASLGGLRSGVTFDLGTAPFPLHKGKPRHMSTGGSFIASYARSAEQKAAAWEFVKFVASEEGQKIWGKVGYLNATKYDLPVLPGQEASYTQLTEGQGATRETNWPGARGAELQKIWENYIARILQGDLGPEQGAKDAKAELLRVMKQS